MQASLTKCSGTQTTNSKEEGGIEEKAFHGKEKRSRANNKENVIKVHSMYAFLAGYILDERINYK